jgi:hypothetical protein
MTQLVTVQTDFTDLEQMAEGLAGRVHATHVILPAGDNVPEGEWASFEIALSDGSAGLTGLGRCVTVVDNGSEREPHQRYDVVLDSLQFETHQQHVFEHVLALHGGGGQQLEEIAAEDAESLPPSHAAEDTGGFDVSTDFTGSSAVSVPPDEVDDDLTSIGDLPDERTMVASPDELESVVESIPSPGGEENDVVPQAAPHSPPALRSNGGGGGYAHASAVAHAMHPAMLEEAFEEPLSGERIATVAQSRPVNGHSFAYTNGIPFPEKPPRPDLPPSLRVTPAPRPAGTSHH